MWTDSHCHIPYEGVGVEAILDARNAGVTRMITVGTDAAQSAAAISLALANEGVWATVGLHPHEAAGGVGAIEALVDAAPPEVVAIGECGLDYYYDHAPRDRQRQAFAAQIALAHAHDLALVIHTREAWDDTLDILGAEGVPERTIFHCFTGGEREARRALDVGGYLSFSGIITFKSATDVREAAVLCPATHLLVETDSPYLTPVPYRGRTNSPAMVAVVGAALATVRSESVGLIEQQTWDNAAAVFRLPALSGRNDTA